MPTEPSNPQYADRHHQRLNLNAWDSFLLNEVAQSCELRLDIFDNRNVGNVSLSSLQVADILVAHDHCAVIQNWYARCAPGEEVLGNVWRSWTQTTVVTLVVGCMPVHQLPLADLLRRREGQRDEVEVTEPGITGFAPGLFEQHERAMATVPRRWTEIAGSDQAAWMSVAKHARSLLRAPLLAVVPPRQNCNVRISSFGPVPVLDARVWVHLEGIYSMDVDKRKR